MANYPVKRGSARVGSIGLEPLQEICYLLRPVRSGAHHMIEPVFCPAQKEPLFKAPHRRRRK